MAPSVSRRVGSVTRSAGSALKTSPIPSQRLQAPTWVLNEKWQARAPARAGSRRWSRLRGCCTDPARPDEHGHPSVGGPAACSPRRRFAGARVAKETRSTTRSTSRTPRRTGPGRRDGAPPVDHDPDEPGRGPAGDQRGQPGRDSSLAVARRPWPWMGARIQPFGLPPISSLALRILRVTFAGSGGLEDLAVFRAPRVPLARRGRAAGRGSPWWSRPWSG